MIISHSFRHFLWVPALIFCGYLVSAPLPGAHNPFRSTWIHMCSFVSYGRKVAFLHVCHVSILFILSSFVCTYGLKYVRWLFGTYIVHELQKISWPFSAMLGPRHERWGSSKKRQRDLLASVRNRRLSWFVKSILITLCFCHVRGLNVNKQALNEYEVFLVF